MKNLKISLPLLALFANSIIYSQDGLTASHNITITVPEVVLLDIESVAGVNITLGYTAPTEAGNPATPTNTNNSLWLNYSSILSGADTSRTISVKTDAVYAGSDIIVTAAADANNGDGDVGTPSAALTLTTSDQTIISDIGSTYTGTGVNNGHQLTYSLVSGGGTAQYEDLRADTGTTIAVTYTISDL